jgi:hypothetical protein
LMEIVLREATACISKWRPPCHNNNFNGFSYLITTWCWAMMSGSLGSVACIQWHAALGYFSFTRCSFSSPRDTVINNNQQTVYLSSKCYAFFLCATLKCYIPKRIGQTILIRFISCIITLL